MGFSDDHFFKIFCTWRFNNSVRVNKEFLENVTRMRAVQIQKFDDGPMNTDLALFTKFSEDTHKLKSSLNLDLKT